MAEYGEDFGYIGRKDSSAKLDILGGVDLIEEDPRGRTSKNSSGGIFKTKSSDPFSPGSKKFGGSSKLSGGMSSFSSKRKKAGMPIVRSGNPSKKSSTHSGSHDPFKILSKLSSVNESDGENGGANSDGEEEGKNHGQDDMMLVGEEERDFEENAEEDKRAQQLMSKEEAENALFKRLF